MRIKITNPAITYELVKSITKYNYERLGVVLLGNKLHFIKKRYMPTDSKKDSATFNIKHIFWFACANKASGIIVYHNHPSGNYTPSTSDKNACAHIKNACDILGITLVDFIIVVKDSGYYSFKEEELI